MTANTGIYEIKNTVNENNYIGQSIKLNSRKNSHFFQLRNNIHKNIHLQRAFTKYGEQNFTFNILLYCEDFELTRYEQSIVDLFNPTYNLLRLCVNSPMGYKHTEETKRKHIGRKVSEETKKKMSNTSKLRRHTQETKLKLSIAGKGRKATTETRLKISESRKFRVTKDETRIKQSIAHKGSKRTEETKENMRKAALLWDHHKPLSQEHKNKISQSLMGNTYAKRKPGSFLGKHHTDEAKGKLSIAAKGRKMSDETKIKISNTTKGRKRGNMSDATKLKLSIIVTEWWNKKRNENGDKI